MQVVAVCMDNTDKDKPKKQSNAGRKPLPEGKKRKMYSTRLHPKVIKRLQRLKEIRQKPVARIIEDLVNSEFTK